MMQKILQNKETGYRWMMIAQFNFLLAALLGAILRYAFVNGLTVLSFRNVMHGHSHVAMLGWIYQALFTAFVCTFLPEKIRAYHRLFIITQVSVWGMFFSFPIEGYGPVSIVLSTIHVICSYIFAFRFWRDVRQTQSRTKNFSVSLALIALGFMLFSSLGLWGMGPVMAMKLNGSVWYHLAVQFYLHFQFNGWFIFAILALFFRSGEVAGITQTDRRLWVVTGLLIAGSVFSFFLILQWLFPSPVMLWTNGFGVMAQFMALITGYQVLMQHWKRISEKLSQAEKMLMIAALGSLFLKIAIQALLVVPAVAGVSVVIRNFVIGFIHLINLGVVSYFLLGYASFTDIRVLRGRGAFAGVLLLLAGFAGSEILLFAQGGLLWAAKGFIPGYYGWILGVSVCIPLGIGLILWGNRSLPATIR
ncbi:MAG: hypothetical protein R3C61_25515 [Bacteroidia bacterium]